MQANLLPTKELQERALPSQQDSLLEGRMSDVAPAERVVLHKEKKRWFLLRPSDGKCVFLGCANPILLVLTEDNIYGMWQAFVYQRGCMEKLSKCNLASQLLCGEAAFTVRGGGPDAKLAQRSRF